MAAHLMMCSCAELPPTPGAIQVLPSATDRHLWTYWSLVS